MREAARVQAPHLPGQLMAPGLSLDLSGAGRGWQLLLAADVTCYPFSPSLPPLLPLRAPAWVVSWLTLDLLFGNPVTLLGRVYLILDGGFIPQIFCKRSVIFILICTLIVGTTLPFDVG